MRSFRIARFGAIAGTVALLAACSDDRSSLPVAPSASVRSLTQTSRQVVRTPALTRTKRLTRHLTVTKWIGAEGGTMMIPDAGLKVVVPAGAVRQRTQFSATALAGDLVAYEFGPHGSTFAVPLEMYQSVSGTNLPRPRSKEQKLELEVGYFRSIDQLDYRGETALVEEILPAEADFKANSVKFLVHHFSGYVVSTGRSRMSASY